MPDLTPRLGIKKPKANEVVSRAAVNENYDIIDSTVATKTELDQHKAAVNPHNITPSLISAVKNSGGVVEAKAGTLASRPSAGVVGRIYVATDTKAIYYDTGSAWVQVATLSWNDLANKPSSYTPSSHASTHAKGGADAITVDWTQLRNIPDIRNQSSAALTLEVRTSDPTSPAVGRIWLRSDL